MEGYITVKKGSIQTNILEKNLKKYLDSGWVAVHKEQKEKPKDYNEYTVKQLRSICNNRNIIAKSNDRKQDIIDKLLYQDEQSEMVKAKPSNKGFTDNLILD